MRQEGKRFHDEKRIEKKWKEKDIMIELFCIINHDIKPQLIHTKRERERKKVF